MDGPNRRRWSSVSSGFVRWLMDTGSITTRAPGLVASSRSVWNARRPALPDWLMPVEAAFVRFREQGVIAEIDAARAWVRQHLTAIDAALVV